MVSLVELDASSNMIIYVHREAFLRHSKLERLDLSSNYIRRIDPNTFRFNPRLTWLSLARNQVFERFPILHSTSLINLHLSSCGFISISPSTFSGLPNLQELHLSHNRIETLPSLQGVENLKILDLSNNHLTSLSTNLLDDLSSLIYLNLKNNWMNSLDVEVVKNLVNISESDDLEGNPWECDCLMLNTTYKWCQENYQKLNILCSSPPSLEGKFWTAYEENEEDVCEDTIEVVDVFDKFSGSSRSANIKVFMNPVSVYERREIPTQQSGFVMNYMYSSIVLGTLCIILMSIAAFLWYKVTSRNDLRSGPSKNASEKHSLRHNNP